MQQSLKFLLKFRNNFYLENFCNIVIPSIRDTPLLSKFVHSSLSKEKSRSSASCPLDPALISTLRACLPGLLHGGPRPFISWHTFSWKKLVSGSVVLFKCKHPFRPRGRLTYWKRQSWMMPELTSKQCR